MLSSKLRVFASSCAATPCDVVSESVEIKERVAGGVGLWRVSRVAVEVGLRTQNFEIFVCLEYFAVPGSCDRRTRNSQKRTSC